MQKTRGRRDGAMIRYFDSLRISLGVNSKNFSLELDPAIVTVPKGFSWKTATIYNPAGGGLTHGFFESDDKECVVTFGVILFDPKAEGRWLVPPEQRGDSYAGDILKRAKTDLLQKMEMKVIANKTEADRLLLSTGLFQEKPNELTAQNFDIVLEQLIREWNSNDAHNVFNADKVIEYSYKRGETPTGYFSKIRHEETISAEKNGRMVILKCLYTDKGYKNKEKYRKSIESIFKFK